MELAQKEPNVVVTVEGMSLTGMAGNSSDGGAMLNGILKQGLVVCGRGKFKGAWASCLR